MRTFQPFVKRNQFMTGRLILSAAENSPDFVNKQNLLKFEISVATHLGLSFVFFVYRKPGEDDMMENYPSFTSQYFTDSGNVSRSDASVHAENQRLRDMLEKERYRRKVITQTTGQHQQIVMFKDICSCFGV